MKTIFRTSVLAGISAMLFFGCEDVQKVTPVPNTNASNLTANFMFVNASPDAPALDFYVNNVIDNSAPKVWVILSPIKPPRLQPTLVQAAVVQIPGSA